MQNRFKTGGERRIPGYVASHHVIGAFAEGAAQFSFVARF